MEEKKGTTFFLGGDEGGNGQAQVGGAEDLEKGLQ